MFPPTPTFKASLRLARLSDIDRIGVVAAASFYHSTWFAYERPYYEKYPLDTMSSYRDSFRKAVLDEDSIVLVVEDDLDQKESQHVYQALAAAYPSFHDQIPEEMLQNGKAVVSAAAFSLSPHSARHGQFQQQTQDTPKTVLRASLNQDKSQVAAQIMDDVLHPQEVETFKDRMVIDMMVTHPAYWRKGHASLITNWYIELAKMDGIGLGVAGAPMGKTFFASKGFKEAKNVEIPGYECHPEPIFAWLGLLDVLQKSGAK